MTKPVSDTIKAGTLMDILYQRPNHVDVRGLKFHIHHNERKAYITNEVGMVPVGDDFIKATYVGDYPYDHVELVVNTRQTYEARGWLSMMNDGFGRSDRVRLIYSMHKTFGGNSHFEDFFLDIWLQGTGMHPCTLYLRANANIRKVKT